MNHALQALMMKGKQREQCDSEHRHRDHDLQQRKTGTLSAANERRTATTGNHCDSTCAIERSPSATLTWPVTGLNTSVIT